MRPIFYDTETTGLKAEKDRIIEIAFYDPIKKKEFVSLINPEMPIPEESTKITKITDDMVKNAPLFHMVIPEILSFCEGDCILVAHNNDAFDLFFLKAEFERAKSPFPSFKFFDSLKWARKYRSDLPRHHLQYLREVYKISENQAHRALDDVIVLHQICEKLLDDLPYDIAWNLLYQTAHSSVLTMPFGKHKGTPLAKLPKNYLEWLKTSGALDKPENQNLKSAIETVMASLSSPVTT